MVFPTPVGMNRILINHVRRPYGVPHTRGDEPGANLTHQIFEAVFPTPVGMNRCPALIHAA